MTQPDELSPDGDLQGAFAAFQGKTQEDYEAERTSGETDRWGGGILAPLFEGLPAGMSFTLAILTLIARQLLGVPTALWDTVEDLIADVPVLGPVADAIGDVLDALLAVVTGSATGGGNPLDLVFGFLGQLAQIPGDILNQLFGQSATNQAQINALNSAGFIHDFSSHGVTGWTTLTPTPLAVSSRGAFVQASTITVAYRSSGVSVNKYGAHFVVNPSMQGVARLGICANNTGTVGVDVEVYRGFDGDALRVVTRASPTLTVVRKQVDFIGADRLSGPISLDVSTDGIDTIFVRRDGQPVTALEWVDTGGVLTHDASHRNVLLTSNGLDTDEDSYYGPQILKVVSYAW